MKSVKYYVCTGFSFGCNNEHLLGVVGDIHSMSEWLKIAFPNKDAETYFDGYSDMEISEYLRKNMKIKLELAKR